MNLITQPTDLLEVTSQLLKAAADPLRLQIINVLGGNSFNVAELCLLFDQRQPAMSHHLKILTQAGLVSSRKEGTSAYYRRTLEPLLECEVLRSAITVAADQLVLSDNIEASLNRIQTQRRDAAQSFFETNATTFKDHQDLIADFPVYGEPIASLINNLNYPPASSVLELGPGRGELLPFLASHFNAVDAVDISQTMLDTALTSQQLDRFSTIELIQGSTETVLAQDKQYDLIVVNMVLHHISQPSKVINDLAQLLKKNGTLLVCDLVRHDQTWVKEACGDLWQGFTTEEMTSWAIQANLTPTRTQINGLRNGFQFQIQLFKNL